VPLQGVASLANAHTPMVTFLTPVPDQFLHGGTLYTSLE